jgi:hypothetical protein
MFLQSVPSLFPTRTQPAILVAMCIAASAWPAGGPQMAISEQRLCLSPSAARVRPAGTARHVRLQWRFIPRVSKRVTSLRPRER